MDYSLTDSSLHGDSPDKNTGLSGHHFLQEIFPTQGLNLDLPHCSRILYLLSHQGNPWILEWVAYPFSRGSYWSRNQTGVSYMASRFCFVLFCFDFLQADSLQGEPPGKPPAYSLVIQITLWKVFGMPFYSSFSTEYVGWKIIAESKVGCLLLKVFDTYLNVFQNWYLHQLTIPSAGTWLSLCWLTALRILSPKRTKTQMQKHLIVYQHVTLEQWKHPVVQLSSVQSRSHFWLFATLWTAAHQASLSITNSQGLLKLTFI